ncbi:hypothetical protein JVU11DRAFT_10796 [Chiua virens]|nr:hypothetical protein JVU11DRAFT_10796 [Chiua virens]
MQLLTLKPTLVTTQKKSNAPSCAEELRKALGAAQLAYSDLHAKFNDLTKRYNMLSREMETQRSKKGSRGKSHAPTSLEQSIVDAGRKYCLLYHLWVPAQLFPVNAQPNVNPHHTSRWQTPGGQIAAEQAELYDMLPEMLHKLVRTFPEFQKIVSPVHPSLAILVNI